MQDFGKALERVCSRLGVETDRSQQVTLKSGAKIAPTIIIRNFGASNGMIVITHYDAVKDLASELVSSGYGFSVLSAPTDSDLTSWESDVETMKSMLHDWGWTGQLDSCPQWYLELDNEL